MVDSRRPHFLIRQQMRDRSRDPADQVPCANARISDERAFCHKAPRKRAELRFAVTAGRATVRVLDLQNVAGGG
jgi:hypothetical protein